MITLNKQTLIKHFNFTQDTKNSNILTKITMQYCGLRKEPILSIITLHPDNEIVQFIKHYSKLATGAKHLDGFCLEYNIHGKKLKQSQYEIARKHGLVIYCHIGQPHSVESFNRNVSKFGNLAKDVNSSEVLINEVKEAMNSADDYLLSVLTSEVVCYPVIIGSKTEQKVIAKIQIEKEHVQQAQAQTLQALQQFSFTKQTKIMKLINNNSIKFESGCHDSEIMKMTQEILFI